MSKNTGKKKLPCTPEGISPSNITEMSLRIMDVGHEVLDSWRMSVQLCVGLMLGIMRLESESS